ncbi:MAG TPA: outer membrane beta-barrel protein [Ignavibacteria bacterium]
MKKLFISLMLVFLISSFSFAQINKNWDGTKPEIYTGSKNFVFVYSPFVSANLGSVYSGSFSNFQDTSNVSLSNLYGIGFQYYVTPQIAVALGLQFGTSSFEPTWAGQTVKYTTTSFGVSVDGNYHFKSLYSVSPYFGLNVNLGTGSTTYEATSGTNTYTSKSSGNSIGFGLNFGFDWYFTPGLSLGGKYTLGMAMNSAPDGTITNGGTTVTYTGPKTSTFGTGLGSIMLNVHF